MSDVSNQMPQRRYDAEADRLFLVYYALPPGFNRNNWGVSQSSIDANIHTAINKPVVVYRRNPSNPYHTHQAGNFVHPTMEEAQAELGHPPTAEEYYNWQEKFAIGRVRSIDKRGEKGYAFTLEITDTDAKNILKSDSYRNGIPGWTSPQIVSNPRLHPEEERTGLFHNWTISHVALVDIPAYGPQQAGLRGKCLGAEKECLIKTRSASQENLGFCVKQATIDLIESRSSSNSSLSSKNATANNITMSEQQNTNQQQPVSGQTVTYNPSTVTTNTSDTINPNQPPVNNVSTEQPQPPNDNGDKDKERPPEGEEQQPLSGEPKSLQEAQVMIRQMSELLRDTNKQLKSQGKELETIRIERKQARLSYIIPRDLFKSDESHSKEVQKAMGENVPESFLIEYWRTRRELVMAQSNKRVEESPLVVKSASSSSLQQGHDVPDFSSSQNTAQASNVQKQLELQRRILEGGVS